MSILRAIATVIFVLCLPVLLITSNVSYAANALWLYHYGFDKYEVGQSTGLSKEELRQVAADLVDYFNSDQELVDIGLFNEREVLHLKDVKGLIQLTYRALMAAAAYLLAYIVVGFLWLRRALWRRLGRGLVWGGGSTIGLLAVLGIWAAIDFRSLFLLFHLISFRNLLWQLSPGDYLLRLFPQGFFFDATLMVAGAAIFEAVILGGAAGIILWRKRNRPPR